MVHPPPASLPTDSSLGWSAPKISAFRGALLAFYEQRSRPLSWRENRDPYRVLVSEVMLQQTRVETVAPYFDRWMERFPNFKALADAQEEEVLTLWAGLGYYSRARRLQATVREVLAQYDGVLPSDVKELEKLPGIGPYTAGAVASIAYGSPVPAVDGNVKRVLSRISDVGRPSPRTLQSWAGELVDRDNPGGFNQALMELGSLVCLPRNPRCEVCPVSTFCAAQKAGTQHLRPTPSARRPPPLFHEAVAVLFRGARAQPRVLLRRRPSKGLLGGMWEFPGLAFEPSKIDTSKFDPGGCRDGAEVALHLATQLLSEMEGPAQIHFEGVGVPLPPLDHTFSHKKVRYTPFYFLCIPTWNGEDEADPTSPMGELRWATEYECSSLPLPAAQRTLASRVWSL